MSTPSASSPDAAEQAALLNYGAGKRFTPNTPQTPTPFVEGKDRKTAIASKPAPSPYAKQLTLAEIRRKNIEDENFMKDDMHLRRFRLINFSSETSNLREDEQKSLTPYYCSCCGAHALVTETKLDELPTRTTDKAFVINPVETFSRIYATAQERVILRRPTGIEVQYRMKCRDCGVALGYKVSDENPSTTYIFDDAVVMEQTHAFAFTRH